MNELLVPVNGIIGGELAETYPFFVVVLKSYDVCGGTIVGPNAVTTAGSCVYRQDKRQWAATSEIVVLNGDFSTSDDWNITRHSSHNYTAHWNTILCFMRERIFMT